MDPGGLPDRAVPIDYAQIGFETIHTVYSVYGAAAQLPGA